eukprot:scaffold302978_cov21-Tisochrysis_lutea.AAC.1
MQAGQESLSLSKRSGTNRILFGWVGQSACFSSQLLTLTTSAQDLTRNTHSLTEGCKVPPRERWRSTAHNSD